MHGFHEVDETTTLNFLPFLTGKLYSQLHHKRYPQDDHPWIWNHYHKQGYVSIFAEDRPFVTFALHSPGFLEAPFTHYMRPFWLAMQKEHPDMSISPGFVAFENAFKLSGIGLCYKNRMYYDMLADYTKRFYREYEDTPKFSLTWFNGPCHDHMNQIEVLDSSIHDMLQSLYDDGHFDNSVIIFMGDHGHRTDLIRQTLVGQMEERSPFLSVSLPKGFQLRGNEKALHTLQSNQYKLTTVLDLHETFAEIAGLQNDETSYMDRSTANTQRYVSHTKHNQLSSLELTLNNSMNPKFQKLALNTDYTKPHPQKADSLFRILPDNRSCSDVSINPPQCSCFYTRPVDRTDKVLPSVINYLLEQINVKLSHPVQLHKVIQAEVIKPGSSLLDIDWSDTWFVHRPVRGIFVFYKLTVSTISKDLSNRDVGNWDRINRDMSKGTPIENIYDIYDALSKTESQVTNPKTVYEGVVMYRIDSQRLSLYRDIIVIK